jgi:hypothetical protein
MRARIESRGPKSDRFRPNVEILEDRLPPGTMLASNMLMPALLGPMASAWTMDVGALEDSGPGSVDGPTRVTPRWLFAPETAPTAGSTSAALSWTSPPEQFHAEGSAANLDRALTTTDSRGVDLPSESSLSILTRQTRSSESNMHASHVPGAAVAPGAVGDSRLDTSAGLLTGGHQYPVDTTVPSSRIPVSRTGLGGGNVRTQDQLIGPNVRANSRDTCTNGRGIIQSETAIAVSGDAIVIGYNDSRGRNCPDQDPGYQIVGWAFSLDGGQTFTDGGPLPGRALWRGDPALSVSPDGQTFYLAGIYNELASLAVARGTVTDSTITWSDPTLITANGPFDKDAITVDPNTGDIYVTYTRLSGPGGIWLAKSTDGGLSFATPVPVSTSGGLQGSAPIVGPNSELYVAWNIGYPTDTGIGFAKSLDGGQTFSAPQTIARTSRIFISGTERNPMFPSMAVDRSPDSPNFGNLYVAFHTNNISGKPDAAMVTSTDGGDTWSAPILINDDGGVGAQWSPTISVDDSGNVNAFFYDRRDNPGTSLTNLYYAQSTDGGQSFGANVLVTDVPSPWHIVGDGFSISWGDYFSSLSIGNDALVAYTDGRDGDPDAYFTRVSNF